LRCLKFIVVVKQPQAALTAIFQRFAELLFQTGPNVNGLHGQGQFSGIPVLLPHTAAASSGRLAPDISFVDQINSSISLSQAQGGKSAHDAGADNDNI
jgi:hypothetical protein